MAGCEKMRMSSLGRRSESRTPSPAGSTFFVKGAYEGCAMNLDFCSGCMTRFGRHVRACAVSVHGSEYYCWEAACYGCPNGGVLPVRIARMGERAECRYRVAALVRCGRSRGGHWRASVSRSHQAATSQCVTACACARLSGRFLRILGMVGSMIGPPDRNRTCI